MGPDRELKPTSRMPRMFAGRRRWLLAQLVVIGFAQAAAAVATVFLVRHTFDLFHRARGSIPEAGLPLGLTLVGVALFDAWLRSSERIRAEALGQRYVLHVRSVLFAHMTRVAPRLLRARNPGGILLRFLGDLTPLRQWVSLGIARITVACVVLPTVLIALAFLSWKLSAFVLLILACGTGLTLSQGARLQRTTRETRRLRSHLVTNVSEKLAAMSVVQIHGQERREQQRVGRQGKRLLRASIDQARSVARLRAILQGTTGLMTVGVLVLGLHEVARGDATPGVVVAVMTLAGILAPSLRDLARVHEYWQGACVSTEKLQQLLALPALDRSGTRRRRRNGPRGELTLQNVSVEGALVDIDVVARAGTVTAIVGPNASGKSTLLALAAGLVVPDRGRILLDGRNIARIRLADLRRAIGMAGPELPLLRGTLLKNLRYRWGRAPEEELARVRALCGIDEMLKDLPDGLSTLVRESGAGLSVGQRQRVCLARAILGTPDLLLLDEIDSNLDSGSRDVLERVLACYPGTVLLATHDPQLEQVADAVWRLEGGRLVETRTPVLGVEQVRS